MSVPTTSQTVVACGGYRFYCRNREEFERICAKNPDLRIEMTSEGEMIEGMEWFRRLPRDQRLAFPEDPYKEMGEKLGIDFG